MCACISDSELVAFLRARHLWDRYCDQFRIKLVNEFGLLILIREFYQHRKLFIYRIVLLVLHLCLTSSHLKFSKKFRLWHLFVSHYVAKLASWFEYVGLACFCIFIPHLPISNFPKNFRLWYFFVSHSIAKLASWFESLFIGKTLYRAIFLFSVGIVRVKYLWKPSVFDIRNLFFSHLSILVC